MNKKIERLVHIAEENVPENFFGRFDLRINRLIIHLFEQGMIDGDSDRSFAEAIGRMPHTVWSWRTYRSFPNSVSLVKMYQAFGVDIHWLCGLRSNNIAEAFDKTHEQGKILAKVA
jgi:hypothetical protein